MNILLDNIYFGNPCSWVWTTLLLGIIHPSCSQAINKITCKFLSRQVKRWWSDFSNNFITRAVEIMLLLQLLFHPCYVRCVLFVCGICINNLNVVHQLSDHAYNFIYYSGWPIILLQYPTMQIYACLNYLYVRIYRKSISRVSLSFLILTAGK